MIDQTTAIPEDKTVPKQSLPSSAYTANRAFLRDLFAKAVSFAAPENTLHLHLPPPPKHGKTLIVAAGKAAASMARAFERAWPMDAPLSGVALTRDGHGVSCDRVTVIEAAHPVPDDRGYEAAQDILKSCEALTADDLMVCLISGGGSSLLALPAPGIPLPDKKEMNRQLLACGAPIGAMNVVRKHVSAIKGGRLAVAAYPAHTVTLALSDVPGDDLATIASGPAVPDESTCHDALGIIERYGLQLPASILDHLKSGHAE
ncbi:MAG: glycerate-2-kinase family protein, partial [Pseudomonadota bacterium]